jgi:hypothetical protein
MIKQVVKKTSSFSQLDSLHPTSQAEQGGCIMDPTQENNPPKKDTPPESDLTKINCNSPLSSENSPSAESVRERRPSTDDNLTEAMDEETPGLAGN